MAAKCLYETFVQGSTLGLLLNFCAKICHFNKLQTASGKKKEVREFC